jgi:hypothetical protein
VNDEWRTRNGVVATNFKILFHHNPGGIEKTTKALNLDSRVSGSDTKQKRAEGELLNTTCGYLTLFMNFHCLV